MINKWGSWSNQQHHHLYQLSTFSIQPGGNILDMFSLQYRTQFLNHLRNRLRHNQLCLSKLAISLVLIRHLWNCYWLRCKQQRKHFIQSVLSDYYSYCRIAHSVETPILSCPIGTGGRRRGGWSVLGDCSHEAEARDELVHQVVLLWETDDLWGCWWLRWVVTVDFDGNFVSCTDGCALWSDLLGWSYLIEGPMSVDS